MNTAANPKPASVDDIKLGQTRRDVVTGFTGIVTTKHELHAGTIQYALTPKMKLDDKGVPTDVYPDDKSMDWQVLDYVDDGIVDRAGASVDTPIKLGDTVQNLVTGLVGIAAEKVTFFNGCVYFMSFPKLPTGITVSAADKTTQPKGFFTACQHLKVVETGTLDKAIDKATAKPVKPSPAPAPAAAAPKARTGGPTRSVPSRFG